MWIPEIFFTRFLEKRNLTEFIPLNMHSIKIKRGMKNMSPEKKLEMGRKSSINRKLFWENMPQRKRKSFLAYRTKKINEAWDRKPGRKHTEETKRKMALKRQEYWANLSEKEYQEMCKKSRTKRSMKLSKNYEKDVRRINTFAGVLTESDLNSL